MKLTQLFTGEPRTDSTVRASQPTPAQAEQMSRQIRSLVPGQTISGEIVSRNGNEVQIRLSEDMVLNARIDRNMNIEVGKNMTFEVKNNGAALTLSPLFTNVSTDMNVLKALDMAGLPVNRSTVDMTEQLMAAGMPVNKGTLQQIFREINSFPQSTVSDIVNLHKLQLPVNEANVNQMVSYRNLSHQLMEGMDAILEALPEVFDSMVSQGDVPGAVRLYQEVLRLVQGEAGNLSAEGQPLAGQPLTGQPLAEGMAVAGMRTENGTIVLTDIQEMPRGEETAPETAQAMAAKNGAEGPQPASTSTPAEAQGQLRAAVAEEVLHLVDSMRLPPEEAEAMRSQILQFAQGQTDAGRFFAQLSTLAEAARTSPGAMHSLERLLSGNPFRELLAGTLKEGWTLNPQDVASPGRVEELYRRLDRQLRGLTEALENAGQSNTTAFRASAAMSQNVDFLQQLNQMYAYVQLPLRMQQGDTHGELYVYSNKRNLARKDGNVSALLHLDMEHLGPVDVYVAMQNSKVSTKFYLRDDEMIDFMAAHMDILTKRLKERGYDCTYAMTTREEEKGEATKGGLEPLLRQEGGVMLSRYAFDVRT